MHRLCRYYILETFPISGLGPELDSSAVKRLRRSEVVNDVLHFVVIQHPEHLELGPGNLEWGQEVDPLHDLITGGGSEGSLVCAVGGHSWCPVDGSHRLQQVHQLPVDDNQCKMCVSTECYLH